MYRTPAWCACPLPSAAALRGNHLSNTTCLTQVYIHTPLVSLEGGMIQSETLIELKSPNKQNRFSSKVTNNIAYYGDPSTRGNTHKTSEAVLDT